MNKKEFDPGWIIHTTNFLIISIMSGYALIKSYPYFPEIVGLFWSAICMFYLSKFVDFYKNKKELGK